MKKIIILLAISTFLLMAPPATKAQHYVKSGDTMWKIAQKNNMFYSRLLEINPHVKNPNMIYIGQKINIADVDKASQLVEYALALQPVTKYVYGAENFTATPYQADCSSWTQHIYHEFGVVLPRVSWEQARTGYPVPFEQLEKGDLMFFGDNGKVSHVGIYMGKNKDGIGEWISNLGTGKDVKVFTVNGSWTQSRFLWGTRVL